MLHGGLLGAGWAETQVTVAQRAQVEALLRAGVNVICDDTNLRARVARELADLGLRCGADVVFRDFTDVPLEECIRRDAARPGGRPGRRGRHPGHVPAVPGGPLASAAGTGADPALGGRPLQPAARRTRAPSWSTSTARSP